MTRNRAILLGLGVGVALGAAIHPGLGLLAPGTGKAAADASGKIGGLFLDLLWMCIVPLVTVSVILGMTQLGDLRKLGRVGGKILLFYVASAALASALAVTAANVVRPGHAISAESRKRLAKDFAGKAEEIVGTGEKKLAERLGKKDPSVLETLGQLLLKAVPRQPVKAMAEGEMIPIIVFALLLGAAFTLVPGPKAAPALGALEGLQEALIRLVSMILWTAPVGVAALMASVVGTVGLDVLAALALYSGTVSVVLVVEGVLVYGAAVQFLGGLSPLAFFRAYRPAMLVAFSSSSSAASLPVNMQCAESLGIPRPIVAFATSIGTTVNMDGTAIFQGVASIFIAQAFGVDLTLGQQVTVVALATIASIGTAPVPSAGIVMLAMILQGAGLPAEGIALIVGVDRVLDMLRTVVNVLGDGVAATVVARWEGTPATGAALAPAGSAALDGAHGAR
ncbi:MAG: dicarboxylate/amino acid:cation symporter [Planctomycetales bacterium]|nr:dicarboxylate/amino acid:cation symporter [Planctomycetales bacterium]